MLLKIHETKSYSKYTCCCSCRGFCCFCKVLKFHIGFYFHVTYLCVFYNENNFYSSYMFITNRFWTTVASFGALFFNGVDLAQDVEQKCRFHLTKLILIITVTFIMKSEKVSVRKTLSVYVKNVISTGLYQIQRSSLPVFSAAGVVGASVVVVVGGVSKKYE